MNEYYFKLMKELEKPTLECIKIIDNNVKKEEKRVNLCIKNKICPECGSQIVRKDIENSYKFSTHFILLKK